MNSEIYEVYEGTEPYLFISYSHQDNKQVEPIIHSLQALGYRVWYDTGIAVGSRWPDTIAEHLMNSNCVVAFISKNAMASDYCQEEIFFAMEEHKPIMAVYLEDTKLPPGLRMRLSARQGIYRYQYRTDAEFINKLDKERLVHASKGKKKPASVKQEPYVHIRESEVRTQKKPAQQKKSSHLELFTEEYIRRYHTYPDSEFVTAVDAATRLQLFSSSDLANATGYSLVRVNQLIQKIREMSLIKELGHNKFRASMNYFEWEKYRAYLANRKTSNWR